MGRLYNFLGLSVGVIVAGLSDEQRKEAYGADITYEMCIRESHFPDHERLSVRRGARPEQYS